MEVRSAHSHPLCPQFNASIGCSRSVPLAGSAPHATIQLADWDPLLLAEANPFKHVQTLDLLQCDSFDR